MRVVLTSCFCLAFQLTFGQVGQAVDSVFKRRAEYLISNDTVNVSFAGQTFRMPYCSGPSPEPEAPVCCHYAYSSLSDCWKDINLSWQYYPDLARAQQQVKEKLPYWDKIGKIYKQTPLTCWVLDQQVSGYQVKRMGRKWMEYEIIVAALVNGQAVVVQLNSDQDLGNEDIPPPMRTILRIKP